MTRIKKRRSGKKRVSDRKKATEGRRGRAKQEPKPFKKDNTTITASSKPKNEAVKADESGKRPTKKRAAGLRRIAASKNIAAPAGRKKLPPKKNVLPKEPGSKKGFAPWNKRRNKNKD